MSENALATAIAKATDILKDVYSQVPNYDIIVPHLLSGEIEQLPEQCHLTPGVPVHPMLAQPTKGVSEVLDRFSDCNFTCEYKYDGERGQIHLASDGKVFIYSRNLENHTPKYPDLVHSIKSFIKEGVDVSSFIIDCEIVAMDTEKNKILPFQVLATRARKGVVLKDIKVQVCMFAFDLLYLNNKSHIGDTLAARRQLLWSCFTEVPGKFQFAKYQDLSDVNEIQTFLNEAVENNCEGLMTKTLDKNSSYEAGKRSYNWLKIKKDYVEGMGDTVDLVPIGAYYGRGKRTGVFGAFLLACYDDENEEYQSICKIGTGFSEADLEAHSTFLRGHQIPNAKPYYRYGDSLACDVWFDPSQVWEVKAADLSISPVHRAAVGIVDSSKGIGLRFPRFIRIRDDKKPEDATSAAQIAEMYRSQKINSVSGQSAAIDDDI